ncbi:MAG: alpha/beta hydrolase [Clostridia bacterium]
MFFKKHKKLCIAISIPFALALISYIALLVYASDYYKADEDAIYVYENNENLTTIDKLTILSPEEPNGEGIIFYPGGKVEATAYLPILEKLQEKGFVCVLLTVNFNLAIFDVNAADAVYEQVPEIDSWYIMGHSLGGATASMYAESHADEIEGLIVLGAYVYGDYPTEKSLTIYGEFNTNVAQSIDYEDNIVVIEGGNHAQFGNYGKQDGDTDATITTQEQQDIAVEAICDFVNE